MSAQPRPYHRLRLWLVPALGFAIAAAHLALLGFTELERLAKVASGFAVTWWIVNYHWLRYHRHEPPR